MSRRNNVFTSIPVLLLAACAADVSEGDLDVAGLEQPSICGPAAPSWIDVELYTNGQLGPDRMSKAFVDAHEKPVGQSRWVSNVQTMWANPQSITNGMQWCSGTLIARDLFLTAGHCVDVDTSAASPTPTDAAGVPIPPAQLVLGQEVAFHYQLEKDTGTVDMGDPYPVLKLEDWSHSGSMDFAILRLGPNVAGDMPGDVYGWARVAAVTPQPGDELTIIQHPFLAGPNALPKVVDTGTVHSTIADGTVNYEDFDVMGGTSGAGILDWQGRLIGVHNRSSISGTPPVRTCGPGLPNMGTLIEAILPNSPLLSALTREVGDHSEVLAAGDFNKDGFNDVVVGVPARAVAAPITGNPVAASGAVRVIYGDANGPDITTEVWLDQNMSASPGFAETGDFFGAAVAVGDFNNDRYADLAIGAPGEDVIDTSTTPVTNIRNAGGVWIFYGGVGGLSGANSVNFDQEDANITTEVSEADDRFGSALATGDFNKDGRDDLAIGTPGETVGANAASGMVTILYGSATGLSSSGYQQFDQNSAIAANEAEAGDRFGSALATGDFDKDGSKDLAIGTPYEDLGAGPIVDAGAVSVLYGSATKLRWRANSRFYQGTAGLLVGVLERGDRLGTSLAAGDLNGDLTSDLIAGAPGEDIGTFMHAGYIHAIYGTANTGLTGNGDVGLAEDSPDVPGNPESEDRLGMSVSVAQLNASSLTNRAVDVLVGAPGEIVSGKNNAGMVIELFGRQGAVLSGTGGVAFHQNTVTAAGDVAGACETGDRLGTVVLAKDLTADGYAEGILSAIGEDIGNPPPATPELFQLLFGSGTGLTTAGNLLFP